MLNHINRRKKTTPGNSSFPDSTCSLYVLVAIESVVLVLSLWSYPQITQPDKPVRTLFQLLTEEIVK